MTAKHDRRQQTCGIRRFGKWRYRWMVYIAPLSYTHYPIFHLLKGTCQKLEITKQLMRTFNGQ